MWTGFAKVLVSVFLGWGANCQGKMSFATFEKPSARLWQAPEKTFQEKRSVTFYTIQFLVTGKRLCVME
jgi:hypothetical protein